MSSLRPKDRLSLCTFTFSDSRQCRTPRSPNHPHLCLHHARKQSQADSADQLADELAFFFSGQYLSANDLSAALGRLFPAVVRGDIKPRTARTLAYLAQTMLQTIHLAQHEYINAYGTPVWRNSIHNSVTQNHAHTNPPQPSESPEVADLQTGAVSSSVPPDLQTAPSAPQPAPIQAHPQSHASAPSPVVSNLETGASVQSPAVAGLPIGTPLPQPAPKQNPSPTPPPTAQPNPDAIHR